MGPTIMGVVRRLAKHVVPNPVQRALRGLIVRVRATRPAYRLSFPTAPDQARKSAFPFLVNSENLLESLGDKYAPSKRSHNYLVYYWMHFRDIRLDVRRVLEIGVGTGRSLRMWEEFFPNAMIHGIDIDPACRALEGGRRRISIGDQRDPRFLEQVITQASEAFDIVIDDGSHRPEDQLRSFDLLFPAMSDHGIYAIEDTGMGDGLRTVNSLKPIVDHVMYWPGGYAPKDWPYLSALPEDAGWLARHAVGIAFYRWIVFVMRGRNPQDNPFLHSA